MGAITPAPAVSIDLASPGPIGGTTPGAGTFTTVTAAAIAGAAYGTGVPAALAIAVNTSGGPLTHGGAGAHTTLTFGTNILQAHPNDATRLANVRGTSPSGLSVFNTYTNTSTYEEGYFAWGGDNVLYIGNSNAAGAGGRTMRLRIATANVLELTTGGATVTGTLSASGAVTFTAGDITGGAGNMTITSGTGASRTLIFKTTTSGGAATTALTLGADQSALFVGDIIAAHPKLRTTGGGSYIDIQAAEQYIDFYAGGSRNLRLYNAAGVFAAIFGDGTQLICLGGTGNTFPALKRSSTTLVVRLADDSADAPLKASRLNISSVPTSSSGLSSGDVWSNSGILTIVP